MKTKRIIQIVLLIIIMSLFAVLRLNIDNMRIYVYDYLRYFMVALTFAFILLSFSRTHMKTKYALPLIFIFTMLISILLDPYDSEIILKIVGSLTGAVVGYSLDFLVSLITKDGYDSSI